MEVGTEFNKTTTYTWGSTLHGVPWPREKKFWISGVFGIISYVDEVGCVSYYILYILRWDYLKFDMRKLQCKREFPKIIGGRNETLAWEIEDYFESS